MRPRRPWNDQRFESEVRAISLDLGRFPTVSDLTGLQRQDLASQIQKRGGFPAVAARLGIDRAISDTDTGWAGEVAAANFLRFLGLEVESREGVKCPYDLLINGVLRIDVKAARQCQYGYSAGWFYRIGKYPQADVVMLWQLDTGRFHVLPWYVCPTTNITITPTGHKYAEYRDNVDLIHQMIAVRAAEQQRHLSLVRR